jgi:hypothetical protein
MTINSQILLGEDGKPSAVQIPYDQFVEIAVALGLDLPDGGEISDEWRDELQRRVRDIDEGRATLIDSEEVWKRVNERFGTSVGA